MFQFSRFNFCIHKKSVQNFYNQSFLVDSREDWVECDQLEQHQKNAKIITGGNKCHRTRGISGSTMGERTIIKDMYTL